MKKIISIIIVTLFAALVLGLSLRGMQGNPEPVSLNSQDWKENGPFELSPERGRFALTYSLIEDKSFFFSVPLARFVMPDLGIKNEQYVSLFAPGVSYLVMPGYLLGRAMGSSQVGSYAIIAFIALLNCVIIYKIVTSFKAHWLSGVLAAGLFVFATPAYAYAVNLYQHHISTFLIVTSLYLAINYTSFWALSVIWLLCGLSIPVDYPNLVLMLPIGIYAARNFVTSITDKNDLKIRIDLVKVLSLTAILLPLTFFLWFNKQSYGDPLQFSGTVESVEKIDDHGNSVPLENAVGEIAETNDPVEPSKKSITGFFQPRKLVNGFYILLLSPDRGLFTYSPVILFSLLGLVSLYKKKPSNTVILVSIILANLLLYGMWSDPWGGWAFGARYLIPSYAILAILVGIAIDRYRHNLLVLLMLLILTGRSVYINTAGALSTSANPPKVQVLSLEKISGRVERYSYDRNVEYLKSNKSKSFVYQSWLKRYISSWQYFNLIFVSITSVFSVCLLILYRSREQSK